MTDNNDAKACELIQDYIGPDHKAIDKEGLPQSVRSSAEGYG